MPIDFLKITIGEFEHESRDLRELSAVYNMGLKPLVVAKGDVTKDCTSDKVEGFQVLRYTTSPFGRKPILKQLGKLCSIPIWAHRIRKLEPRMISGHDMIATFIGYLSTLFMHKDKKPKLVYEAHEFEAGRNVKGGRSAFKQFLVEKLEHFIIKKSDLMTVVAPKIASAVADLYKLPTSPLVIRNIPSYWHLDTKKAEAMRNKFLQDNNWDKNTKIIMYHGSISSGRGIETLLEATKQLENHAAIILGYGPQNFKEKIKKMASQLGISNRIKFYDAVSVDKLPHYIAATDIEYIVIPPVTKSYYFALPNKFFESIQALTPMVISDLPEMKSIVNSYDIGMVVPHDNLSEIVKTIKKMTSDPELYKQKKKNLEIAKKDLCWENEQIKLQTAYKKLLT